MNVRPATVGDLAAIERLHAALETMQRPWRVFSPRRSAPQEFTASVRDAIAHGSHLVLVAEDANEVVAVATASEILPSRVSDERAVEIGGVFVREDRRGEGIGRLLVAAALEWARARDLGWASLRCFAGNAGALAFWEELGFTARAVDLVASLDDVDRHLAVS